MQERRQNKPHEVNRGAEGHVRPSPEEKPGRGCLPEQGTRQGCLQEEGHRASGVGVCHVLSSSHAPAPGKQLHIALSHSVPPVLDRLGEEDPSTEICYQLSSRRVLVSESRPGPTASDRMDLKGVHQRQNGVHQRQNGVNRR